MSAIYKSVFLLSLIYWFQSYWVGSEYFSPTSLFWVLGNGRKQAGFIHLVLYVLIIFGQNMLLDAQIDYLVQQLIKIECSYLEILVFVKKNKALKSLNIYWFLRQRLKGRHE